MLSTNPLIRSSYWFFGSPASARSPWRRTSAAETSISSSCSKSDFVGGWIEMLVKVLKIKRSSGLEKFFQGI